jgi:hypothetical protein
MTGLALKNLGQLFSQKTLTSLGAGLAASAIMLGGAFAKPASAATIGDITLSDDGFAIAAFTFDTDLNEGGPFIGSPSGDVIGSLTDQSIDTFVFSSDRTGFVLLEFADVLNGGGDDVALFSLQNPNALFRVSADFGTTWGEFGVRGVGDTTTLPPIVPVFAAEIDLSRLGIAEGSSINSLLIDFATGTTGSPILALAGTIQRSVPEPSAMFGLLATVGFLASNRGLKRAKKA